MTPELPPLRQISKLVHPGEAADVREFEGYRPTGDAIDQLAADWLLQRCKGHDVLQEARLGEWLAEDPRHRAAFARHQATWTEIDALPSDGVAALRTLLPIDGARPSSEFKQHRFERRGWLMRSAGFVFSVVMLAGTAWGVDAWWHSPIFSGHYETARGELRTVTLADGSQIQLDTNTQLDVVLYRQKRQVSLHGGRALFEVAHDSSRSFDVVAGTVQVTVVGTRFTVRRWPLDDAKVEVAVEQGRVRVVARSTAFLGAGDVVASTAGGELGDVKHIDAPAMTGWRKGRLAFEGKRLDDALVEFERYGDTHLHIADPAVAALQISGSFDARRPMNFARIAADVLPIQLKQTPNGILLAATGR